MRYEKEKGREKERERRDGRERLKQESSSIFIIFCPL